MGWEQFMWTMDVVPGASGKNNIVIGVPLVSSGSVAVDVVGCHVTCPITAFKPSMANDQI